MSTNKNEPTRQNNASHSGHTEDTNTQQGHATNTDGLNTGNPQTSEVYNTGSNGMGINPNNSDMLWQNSAGTAEGPLPEQADGQVDDSRA